jgi:hypothetical protein
MYHLSCGEIWGGIRNCDDDISSAGLTASLFSLASDGGKGGDIYYLSRLIDLLNQHAQASTSE